MEDKTFVIGSVFAAMLASLCCIGPLIAVALGLGAFGAATLFESLRPYLLVATAALLGAGFYFTYRKQPRENCEGEACAAVPQDRTRKILLWIATGAVAAFAALPYYSGWFWNGASGRSSTALAATGETKIVEFDVEGMTCAGCAATLENALKNAPGVTAATVSWEDKAARVNYDPSQVSTGKLLRVIKDSGFQATLRSGNTESLKRLAYQVEGMTCSSCARGIEAALSRRNGIKKIRVHYEEKTAEVLIDPALVTPEQLSKAFAELGYTVTTKSGTERGASDAN